MSKTKSVEPQDKLVTREQVAKMLNLYHWVHHVPWYVKAWKRLQRRMGR